MNIIWFNSEVRFGYPLTCPSYGCEQKYYDRKLRDLPKTANDNCAILGFICAVKSVGVKEIIK